MTPTRPALALLFALTAGARTAAARAAADDDADSSAPAAADAPADAQPAAPDANADQAPPPGSSMLARFYPPPIDGPELRFPDSPTRLYLDAGFAQSRDLSALPYIAGSGTNFRFALGGAWRWRDFAFEAEVPFLNVTSLDVTSVSGGAPDPERQTASSFGDVRAGAIWTKPLIGEALAAGFGMRVRVPTHTTRFQFYLMTNDEIVTDYFPYYFHLEPTSILGGAIGRFLFVVNEGLLVLIGPNGDFLNMEVVVPTIAFWDSHVAIGFAPFDFLAVSVELGTDIQVNTVNDAQFPLNNLRSTWVAPALQLHFGDYRVDLIARLGFGRGTDALGVLDYTGTDSYSLRVGRTFN